MTGFSIAGRPVGPHAPPLVVAELSGNHDRSLERALALVDAAAEAGAHAVKLQTYTADTMTLPLTEGDFAVRDEGSPWHGRSLYELYEEAHTPWEWHAPIFARCRQRGLIAFSTPFDLTAVDFLEDLDVPAYKIASFENTDERLIRKAAATGKPLIISVGMATVGELERSVHAARDAGAEHLALLRCTSAYPAEPRDAHLRTLPHLRALFDVEVGLSDHTLGIGVSVASVALGAVLIERHFTLRRADGGVDAAFSLEPAELAQLVVESRRAWEALGEVRYAPTARESTAHRRSLYVAEDMRAGDTFTANNLRAIRPGGGLAPRHYDLLLGRRVRRDAPRGTPVRWELLFDDEDVGTDG